MERILQQAGYRGLTEAPTRKTYVASVGQRLEEPRSQDECWILQASTASGRLLRPKLCRI